MVTDPFWLKPYKGVVSFPVRSPFTDKWYGWVDGKITDITEEYLKWIKEQGIGLMENAGQVGK